MKEIMRAVFIALTFFCVLPFSVEAGPVIRTGDTVSLKEDQKVDGDLYVLGGTVTSSAEVVGDVHVVAGGTTLKGTISGDVTAIVGNTEIHAPVGDDVRILGGRVVIADIVKGDVAVFGGEVTILSTAHITGDVLFYGGSLDIEGPVDGSVLATGERIRIDSTIRGDIDTTAYTSLVFGSHADVAGNVTYKSPHEIVRALESVIVGNVQHEKEAVVPQVDKSMAGLMPFLVLLFTSLVARFIFGRRIDEFVDHTLSAYGVHGVVGCGLFLAAPLAIVLLFVSVLGFIIGLGFLFSYLAMVVIAAALTPNLIGALLARVLGAKHAHSMWWAAAGTGLLFLFSHVPYIGIAVLSLPVLMIVGGMSSRVYAYLK